jgi:BTG family
MHEEIQTAVEFICILLPKSIIPKDNITSFANTLTHLLTDHCSKSKWIPHTPLLGSAYRAITCFDSHIDKLIINAASATNISLHILQNYLPKNFIIWIDPYSVSYRLRDIDNITSLYEASKPKYVTIKDPKTGKFFIPSNE